VEEDASVLIVKTASLGSAIEPADRIFGQALDMAVMMATQPEKRRLLPGVHLSPVCKPARPLSVASGKNPVRIANSLLKIKENRQLKSQLLYQLSYAPAAGALYSNLP
jgi:hypothetical protein